ncbi:hypothetical protein AGMMS49574_28080 [Bacteroidia bacterium]|nr:hypothetical protein AGMMS49574_28080 [Bacteroidia bacterium]
MKAMKTVYHPIKALSLCVLLSASATLVAQEENEGLARQLTLEREYDPSVQDANKVNTLPAIKEPTITRTPIDYAFLSIPTDPPREIGVLPASRIMADMKYNKRRGYLNFGGGTYLNLNGDAGYHILSSDKDQLNVFFSHRSTNGNVKYLEGFLKDEKVKAKLNDNLGGVDFRHVFKKVALSLGGRYAYTAFNYYGLPYQGLLDMEEDVDTKSNQVNQRVTVKTGLESLPGIGPLDYYVNLDYTNFWYKYGKDIHSPGITEHTMDARFGLSAAFNGNRRVGVDFKFIYFNYNLPLQSTAHFGNYLEGTLQPYYKIEGDSWNIKLGANVMFYTDDSEKSFLSPKIEKVFVSPNIAMDINVGSKTVLYLDAGGRISSNSAFQLSRENLYIDPYDETWITRIPFDATLGVKSGILPGFWFNVFGGYRIAWDDYFYIPNRAWWGFGNISQTIPLDSKLLRGGLELKYAYQRLFEVSLKGVYNRWKVENKHMQLVDNIGGSAPWEPYGRPKAEITAGLLLRPVDKFAVSLDYYLATGRYVRKSWNEKMKDINELNFTGSYTFNDTFGAYIKLNNLLFRRYELIYGYPLQGFNAMAGININF